MLSIDCLRKFVTDRLNAAVEEIFGVFERTITEYEEEISRQRRLLDITYNSDMESHGTDVPSQQAYEKNEVPSEYQPCDQLRRSRLDQEPPQIKEEQQELCTKQDGEHLELKQETDSFIITSTQEQSDLSKEDALYLNHSSSESGAEIEHFWRVSVQNSVAPEPKTEHQLLSNVHETRDYTGCSHDDWGLNVIAETKTKKQDTNFSAQLCSNNQKNKSQSNSRCQLNLKRPPSKKSVVCPICGKTLGSGPYLKVHMRSHTGEKPYLCKTCGKRFHNTSLLSRHTKIHTGERPHVCETCGKGFPNVDRLNRHTRIHTDERPYSCQICKKVFRYSSDLLIHIRRDHTGEKPYGCQTCGQRFSEGPKLKRHMKIHRDERLL